MCSSNESDNGNLEPYLIRVREDVLHAKLGHGVSLVQLLVDAAEAFCDEVAARKAVLKPFARNGHLGASGDSRGPARRAPGARGRSRGSQSHTFITWMGRTWQQFEIFSRAAEKSLQRQMDY